MPKIKQRTIKMTEGQELKLAAKYFAVSNQGHEPDQMSVQHIQFKYDEVDCALVHECGIKAGLEPEFKWWLKDLKQGPGVYAYDEWQKLRLEVKGLERK